MIWWIWCVYIPGQLAATKLLLEHKAMLLPERKCEHPLLTAGYAGHLTIVRYLIEELNVNLYLTDIEKETCLHYACLKGHTDIVRYYLDRVTTSDITLSNPSNPSNPSSPSSPGGSGGSGKGLKDTVEMRDFDERTPLLLACLGGHVSTVKCLIEIYIYIYIYIYIHVCTYSRINLFDNSFDNSFDNPLITPSFISTFVRYIYIQES